MGSEQIGSSRSKENRAVTTQERKRKNDEEVYVSLVRDDPVQTGERFSHYVCPVEGEVTDLRVYVERSIPNEISLEAVCSSLEDDMVTVRKFKVKQGSNSLNGFGVNKWERIRFKVSSDESKAEGIWIGFIIKKGQ